MNSPTDHQLKLALAKELPELIHICETYSGAIPQHFVWKAQTNDNQYVTDREWDWVVNQVIAKLGNKRWRIFDSLAENWSGVNIDYNECASATWQQRAIAYFKTTGKEIV